MGLMRLELASYVGLEKAYDNLTNVTIYKKYFSADEHNNVGRML